MRRLTAAAVVFLLCPGLVAGPVLAAGGDPIGATLSVVDIVTAAYNRDTRTLAAGDGVRQNELIDVSRDGSTELKLNDETKLALGPGAKLLLDKFVYDPDKATGDIGVDLVEGASRFMTGVAKKPSYVVKVPRASITVRGTIFDVYVQEDDTSWLLLHEGGVRCAMSAGGAAISTNRASSFRSRVQAMCVRRRTGSRWTKPFCHLWIRRFHS